MFKYINFLLLAILLLIFSCDEELKPVIEGCTIETACNYKADATDNDDSCVIGEGCNQWCPGNEGEPLNFDCASNCGGVLLGMGISECINNSTINDSLSCITNGSTWDKIGNDECGVCGGDGIWAGIIGPYNIIDLFYTYHITENLDLNLSALNLNNDLHKELIGGAIMGRQVVMRFTSTF